MNPETPDDLAKTLGEIARAHMPFGKYGPANYPPNGVPIYDLPYEYLAWLARKSRFPKGRLGEQLEFVFLAKRDGADAIFDPVRRIRGGRTNLRAERRKEWTFGEED
jgi:uncharacterized protein (DUF3820 family)